MDFLSVRMSDVSGGVANRVRADNFSLRSGRLVLLVHGFNVTQQSGQESYLAFGALLEKNGVSNLSILGQIVGFLWPGDANLGPASALSYPFEMGAAKTSAAVLTNFILTLRGPQGTPIQLILVAHSLGNRLALEFIGDLLSQANQNWGRLEGLCLMAAAVPVSMAQDINKLGRAAQAAQTRTLFSKEDTVLRWAFPPGETAAREGWFPEAVGRFGNPTGLWTSRFDLQPYSHGDYFPGKGSDDRSARYVAQFLGAAVSTAPTTTQPVSNVLPPANNINVRNIGNL